MSEAIQKPFIVDMDSHVMEPPDLWENYLEPRYRDRAIHIRRNSDGIEELVVDDKVLLKGRLAALGGVEHPAQTLFTQPDVPYLEGCPLASYDTQARIELLDEWGVDAGVVFPTIGILWDKEDDPELAMAYARAYNNWQWDFASPALDRILPIAHIPLYDVDLALEELQRCLKLGFKGMFMAPEPVCGKRPSHPDFDPLWQELVDADLPVCVHLIVRFTRALNLSATSWWDSEKEPMNTVFSFALGGTMQLIPATAALICDGLFDRFPKLKVAIVESGAGYASYLMDRLDEKYDRFGELTNLKRRPSEYMRENFWFVMDPSERSIDAQCDLLGEDHFLWGSDYPHIDSHIGAIAEVHEALAPMSEHRRNLVLGGNAVKLFNL
ncbi:MAG TPA: amidohydrolase [Pseudomonadales bacterium]|nr:amidohydrolase [Gammaproteobacteria bacterium]HIL85443.1 amidohydrolase [Pseudomonadales bacterium]